VSYYDFFASALYKHLAELGYSAPTKLTIEDRLKLGKEIEDTLAGEKDAAKAPPRDSSCLMS
jgi:hypothetical protein